LKNVAANHFNQTRNGKGYTMVTQINEFAQPVEDIQSIQQVATISSGNDEIIGSLIADALSKVGKSEGP
jgi:chaperonin GroEL (HSP60 family)